jgi:hypothetical protein
LADEHAKVLAAKQARQAAATLIIMQRLAEQNATAVANAEALARKLEEEDEEALLFLLSEL